MATIELYELEGCPYCAKVTRKLDELGLEYESHYVSAPHGDRQGVKEVSGGTQVPVVVDEDHGIEGMDESDDIVRYLEETYGDGENTESEGAPTGDGDGEQAESGEEGNASA